MSCNALGSAEVYSIIQAIDSAFDSAVDSAFSRNFSMNKHGIDYGANSLMTQGSHKFCALVALTQNCYRVIKHFICILNIHMGLMRPILKLGLALARPPQGHSIQAVASCLLQASMLHYQHAHQDEQDLQHCAEGTPA